MAADSKKVQSLVNQWALSIQTIRLAISDMKAIRATFNTVNPVLTGTCVEGKKVSWSAALDQLDEAVNGVAALSRTGGSKTDWDEVVACYVPSHRGKAL